MNVLQRSISVLLFALLCFWMIFFSYSEGKERWDKKWREVQLQRFINQVKNSGECNYEGYVNCLEQLQLSGVCTMKIREYIREEDIVGNKYRYLVAWEEIMQELVNIHSYSFSAGSVFEVELETVQEETVQIKKYYSVVRERE